MQAQLKAEWKVRLTQCRAEGTGCKVWLEVEFKAQPEAEYKGQTVRAMCSLLLHAGHL